MATIEEKDLFKRVWETIDYNDGTESHTISSDDEYGDIEFLALEQLGHQGAEEESTLEDDMMVEGEDEGRFVLPQELTETSIKEMLEAFVHQQRLVYRDAVRLVREAQKLLRAPDLDALTEVAIPQDGRVIVVGDLHGQIIDLRTIFDTVGFPSSKNVFLFNGDFVDRGPNGVETLLTLLACKVLLPNCVFFNRGNHENSRMNEKYNFSDQCADRYRRPLYDDVMTLFTLLPLSAVVGNKVFVVHGGLSAEEDFVLDDIRGINFRVELPRHREVMTKRELVIMEQMLWSDPRDIDGHEPSRRGAGVHFGKQITASFLERNNLEFVIRSHEMVDEGFEWRHDNKLVTLFSASCYSGKNMNKGAVCIVTEDGELKFEAYYAETVSKEDVQEKLHAEQKAETLERLRERIFEHRSALLLEFAKADSENIGVVTVSQWATIMQRQLKIDIDWTALQPYLAKARDGEIGYVKALERYRIPLDKELLRNWGSGIIRSIRDKVLGNNRNDIYAVFDQLDVDKNDAITYDEFVKHLDGLNLGLSTQQTYDLMRVIDTDRDGSISFDEFVDAFDDPYGCALSREDLEWLQGAVKDVGAVLQQRNADDLKASYDEMNYHHSKHGISHHCFKKALWKILGMDFTSRQLDLLTQFADKDNSGRIDFDEFLTVFQDPPPPKAHWQTDVLQEIISVLFKSRVQLKRAFRLMDSNNDGTVDTKEFKAALGALDVVSKHALKEEQIQQLFDLLDKDGSQGINYQEFIDSFQVVDAEEENDA